MISRHSLLEVFELSHNKLTEKLVYTPPELHTECIAIYYQSLLNMVWALIEDQQEGYNE